MIGRYLYGLFAWLLVLMACTPKATHVTSRDLPPSVPVTPPIQLSDAHLGYVFMDRATDEVLLARQSEVLFTPASLNKLVWGNFFHETLLDTLYALRQIDTSSVALLTGYMPTGLPTLGHTQFGSLSIADQQVCHQSVDSFSLAPIEQLSITPLGPGWMWDDSKYSFQKDRVALILRNQPISQQVYSDKRDSLSREVWTAVCLNKEPRKSQPAAFLRDSIIAYMLATSDNMFAEQLGIYTAFYQTLDYNYQNDLINWTDSLSRPLELPTAQAHLVDASGLSRYNQVSPLWLVRYIDYCADDYIALLPAYTSDMPTNADIYAKTGSMQNIYNVAGIMTTSSGRKLDFCVMINHSPHKRKDLEGWMVEFLNRVAANY